VSALANIALSCRWEGAPSTGLGRGGGRCHRSPGWLRSAETEDVGAAQRLRIGQGDTVLRVVQYQ
jgi:hypothetical protein